VGNLFPAAFIGVMVNSMCSLESSSKELPIGVDDIRRMTALVEAAYFLNDCDGTLILP